MLSTGKQRVVEFKAYKLLIHIGDLVQNADARLRRLCSNFAYFLTYALKIDCQADCI